MVEELYKYEIHEFYWGTAVKEQRTGKYLYAYLRPDGREIDLQGIDVKIHENGIEFL